MLSGDGFTRERELVNEIAGLQGHEYHAALLVSLAILGNQAPLNHLDREEREMVRRLVEKHGFRNAAWAEPLFQKPTEQSKPLWRILFGF